MAGETQSLIPNGSVAIGGKEVEYSTLFALGVGVRIGMILKS